ncbi:MAG: bifunctional 2-C-methyl-D-erythritol 4-phosphate cytidylyltransferase/2-C-methyl-D-erythritol 2,4-cyclodiphosphate synthase [Campylobacterales bacterium]|nr:bifunctional 2-C-methyl-D-erythritol 4-phosphate cytidylyltransferase/2-C-methyl-D-erythritol 2,4-cyclodiphosphate synthase [Campylobacterales bacterium]
MRDVSLVLLSAGNSTRFAKPVKKQWLRVGDKPLWEYVTDSLTSYCEFKNIVIVSHPDEVDIFESVTNRKVVAGGKERQDSIKNALEHIDSEYVLITDIARSCIPKDMFFRIVDSKDEADCVVPYLRTPDTTVLNGEVLDRDNIKLIQTPQLSRTELLKEGISKGVYYTDESTLISANGGSVKYVEGSLEAKKITYGEEIKELPCIKPPSNVQLTGYGFDVHEFENGKIMWLGGLEIESDFGFKAHSDGDVAIHALIDALLGACGLGDIGEWFPDTDERYKDVDSKLLLNDTRDLVNRFGYDIVNVDIEIMAEAPKLKKYKTPMRKKIAEILKIRSERVNVKATTTEKLGFVGRKEGVAVSAVANVKYFDWSEND